MRARWSPLFIMVGLGVAYVAYPYITLYRLGAAISTSDAATLESLVDWPAVREGIKEDICDSGKDAPATAGNELPAFGASFVRGVAAGAVDRAVTPQALLAATVTEHPTPGRADVGLRWAFFESPTRFSVRLHAAGEKEPIRIEMDLRHGRWQVRRVWLPDDMLVPGSKV